MNKELTCIVCPLGCQLKIEIEDEKIKSVTGNTCKRGESYAVTEMTNPTRVITTTVRTKTGEIVPVKTDGTVEKNKIFDYMKVICGIHPDLSECNMGNVIHTLDNGVNVVVTSQIAGRD